MGRVDPIGDRVVGRDVIDLLGRLVVPRAPGVAAVERHDRALIVTHEDTLAIRGVDPHHLRIVAARRSTLECHEAVAAVGGLVGRDVEGVNDVGILRIDVHAAVIAALAIGDAFVVRGHVAPRRAAVIGPIQSEVADQIDALRRGGVRDGNGDAAAERRQSSAHDLAPSDAAIRGLIETRTHARRVRLW